jgi:hypothetical protein
MRSFVKQHLVAIILAFAFGLLSAGPFILFASLTSASGMVVYPEITNDQDFYLSRVQEVRDGVGLGNSYLFEYKSVPTVQLLTGEYVEAFVLDMLNLSTGASLFIFPLILLPTTFLLMYCIFLVLRASRFWALVATSTIAFWIYFSVFARPISPQFNFIFWLLAALSLFVLVKNESWRVVLAAALSYGALFYIYPYYWTHFTVVYGLLFILYLFLDRRVAARVFAAGLGGVIIGSGYFYSLFEARSLPIYQETLERLGLTYTHFPSGGLVAVGATLFLICVTILLIRAGRMSAPIIVSFALVLGGMIAMNQHLVTGMNLEFSSHYAMQIVLSCIFLLVSIASAHQWSLGKEANRFFSFAVALILILLSVPVISSPYAGITKLVKDESLRARAEVVLWLKNNAGTGVVYAPDLLSYMIPAYTSHDVFYARAANFFFMPNEEVVDRALLHYYNAPLSKDFVEKHQREFFGQALMNPRQHALRKKELVGWLYTINEPAALPQEKYEYLVTRRKEIENLGFLEAIKPYRVDYLIVPPSQPLGATEKDLDDSFVLKAVIEGYKIYARE